MKLNRIIVAIAVVGLLLPGVLLADSTDLTEFYGKCIDQRIQQCKLKAATLEAGTEGARQAALTAERKAQYYELHRDLLVRQMVEERVARNSHRVNRYLVGAYTEYLASQPAGAALVAEVQK
jgi:hypothetical protein